jgi:hypothetical protein
MFVRTKVIDGKKRRYLVESCWDKKTKKHRQRHIEYVDGWPKKDIARLIRMIKKYRDAWANSERPENTKAYKRVALDKAVTLDKAIQKFKRDMRINLVPSRNKGDRRRLDADTGKRHLQKSASGISPLTALSHSLNHSFALFEKWTETEPLADWDTSTLETLVVETKQIHDLHEEAKRLLNAKTMK